MKKLFTLIVSLLLFGALESSAQVFWTENFIGGSTGLEVGSYTSTNGAWSLMVTGAEGSEPNPWYVSCTEAGHLATTCGSTCTASMGLGETLHIGADAGIAGDGGAAYDAGGLCGLVSCPETDRRAQSPTINCTGKTNIRLKFYYIMRGQTGLDFGTVYYSSDNGASWSLLLSPAQTSLCPSTQGRWDSTSVMLPASANNNPIVKIGFRWQNNDDGVGTDPSFAVDSVSLRTTPGAGPVVPSMSLSTTTACQNSCIIATNTSTGTVDSFKWSCPGCIIGTPSTSPDSICFSTSGTKTVKLYLYVGGVKVDSASTTVTINPAPVPHIIKTGSTLSVTGTGYSNYQWYTVAFPPVLIAGATNSTYTYTTSGTYAVTVDSGGCTGYATLNTTGFVNIAGAVNSYWLAQTDYNTLTLRTSSPNDETLTIAIYDATGRKVYNDTWNKGEVTKHISSVPYPPGMYIIRLSNINTSAVLKWQK